MAKKIGLVLSGGGVRGFAHLGLLKALDEMGIRLHAISGVSAGAIAGAFYAAGHKPEKILGFLKENSYFGWSNLLFNRDGFFSMRPLLELIEKQIPGDCFENLLTKLFVTATDFSNNESLIFSTGSLSDAVIASSSVPIIFEPFKHGEQLLVDGGLLNNFPIEPLQNSCDKVIGCYVNNLGNLTVSSHLGKSHIIDRCFHMITGTGLHPKIKECDVFIEPGLQDFGIFDTGKADLIFEIGYKAALEQREKLVYLLSA